jgi:hypothetical protein
MYVLFSKSQEIHQIQIEQKLKVFSLKRINTQSIQVEFFLKSFFCGTSVWCKFLYKLRQIGHIQHTPDQLQKGFDHPLKRSMFWPPHTFFVKFLPLLVRWVDAYRVSTVDLDKALGLIYTALSRLQRSPKTTAKPWIGKKKEFIHRHRVMDGDIATDEPAQSAKDERERESFMLPRTRWSTRWEIVLRKTDHCCNLSHFLPQLIGFPGLVNWNVSTGQDMEAKARKELLHDVAHRHRCADELFNNAESFQKFNSSRVGPPREE